MAKILVLEKNSATQNLLVKHLQTGGFEVINLSDRSVEANLVQKKMRWQFSYLQL